jgi:lambda family phage portal protein
MRANWLDRIIGWFDPARASRRLHARMSMVAAERFAYEAARMTRRTAGWLASDTGPNAEIAGAATRLRARSRDLVRNNPFAARAVAAIAQNAVGTGIVARTQQREAAALWRGWIEQCDADGVYDWYGLQALVARTVVESGECLVRFRPRRQEDGIWPPLQLQVLEPDYLDSTKTGLTGTGYMIQGIQFDLVGRRIGYWLFDRHPGEVSTLVGATLPTSKLVPASEVLHVYRKDRPGQERGVPWLAPVIMRMRDLDDYEEAELVRKKIEACFAAFVVGGDPGRTLGASRTDAGSGQRIESFEPGMIAYLSDSEDVRFATPQPSSGYPEYVRHQLRAIAAGLGMPYEVLTGDLSQTNYSSIRAGLLEFRRMIDQFRWQVLIQQFCQPVWDRVMSLTGIDAPVTWTPPKWDSVDPYKEASAVQTNIRNGLVTWREAVSEMGYDPDEQLAEIAATNEAWDRAGIVLDCDPRRVTQGGAIQKEL